MMDGAAEHEEDKGALQMKLGACYDRRNGSCLFTLWAPLAQRIEVRIVSQRDRTVSLDRDSMGYWTAVVRNISPGDRYLYKIDGKMERPDPASHCQPDGVHNPSQIIDHDAFSWQDSGWPGIPLSEMILYELHVGTFTSQGTFDAVISRIDDLKDIGINTIEIMPVAQFPGERNWGYDGVYPFAVQNSYGGPEGLKTLVNACHQRGMSVVLDVVYNHLGPEGNYLQDFGPYFTDRYKTPWGQAVNFDGPYSNEVRSYFIENALSWFKHYHIDALRIDAIHGIYDMSARHFLLELSGQVGELSRTVGRKLILIAESDLNDAKAVIPGDSGGLGLDALWCDDFHHSLHTSLTGEKEGYYVDFGRMEHLETSLREGFVYSGRYSTYRKRNHGNSSGDLPAERFIVFSQNHDQIGNRMRGERLSSIVSFEALKLSAGVVLLSPYVPLIFMGEEYGEDAPFLYFVSHSDPSLIEAVREGRKEEFRAFTWNEEPPDPQDRETFMRSKLIWQNREKKNNRGILEMYRELIRLRKALPALANLDNKSLRLRSEEEQRFLIMERWKDNSRILALFNFHEADTEVGNLPVQNDWSKVMDSSDMRWNGPGTLLPETILPGNEVCIRAESFALFTNEPLNE